MYTKKLVEFQRAMSEDELRSAITRMLESAARQGESLFMGQPDSWYEKPGPKFRCPNDHVSTCVLKSEGLGRNACLECFGILCITFPEDKDGPLVIPERYQS